MYIIDTFTHCFRYNEFYMETFIFSYFCDYLSSTECNKVFILDFVDLNLWIRFDTNARNSEYIYRINLNIIQYTLLHIPQLMNDDDNAVEFGLYTYHLQIAMQKKIVFFLWFSGKVSVGSINRRLLYDTILLINPNQY